MSSRYETAYKDMLIKVMGEGSKVEMRDGYKGINMFGLDISFNLASGKFPMLTGKAMFFKNTKAELLWMLTGRKDLEFLHKYNVRIWDQWDMGDGTIGNSYGHNFRNFMGVDQVNELLKKIAKLPSDRQLVISTWNPVYINEGHKPSCYPIMQFSYINNRLNMLVHQRSADLFVGLPYDMAYFALFTELLASYLCVMPGTVKISIGDAHIYEDHLDAIRQYLVAETYELPSLYIGSKEFPTFDFYAVDLRNYKSSSYINAKILY